MMWPAAKALMARDLLLLWRRRGDALQPALFALLAVVLFALALGGEAQALAKVASAVLWLAMLHGTNGVRTIINDYAEKDATRLWLKIVLYAATTVIIILGTLVIFTFNPCPVANGVQLPGGFCPAP